MFKFRPKPDSLEEQRIFDLPNRHLIDWSLVDFGLKPTLADKYAFTNESVAQILGAMNLSGDEKIMGVLGAGDQCFGMLSQLKSGSIYGVDGSSLQMYISAMKLDLIGVLDRNQYAHLISDKLILKEKEIIESFFLNSMNVCDNSSALRKYALNTLLNWGKELRDIEQEAVIIDNDQNYFNVRNNVSKLEFGNINLVEEIPKPDNSFDWVYLSNVPDYVTSDMWDFVAEIKRVLVPFGKVYACTSGMWESSCFEYLNEEFEFDGESYELGKEKGRVYALGSPKGKDDFFVGINNK